ncbi:MAG TPA: pitrilysin family protein [Gemmatimonadaceae bacterium]|nr:pitrilysin family protein [Gemmatimonadaceae bacterium]
MRRMIFSALLATAIASPLRAQDKEPPKGGPLRPYAVPSVQTFTLNNGLKVLLVERHSLPVVTARFIVDAGAMREPAEKNGLAVLTGNLLSEGAKGLTGAQIAEQMADLGAQLNTFGDQGTAYVALTSLSNVFPKALAIAATTLTDPTFSQSDFDRLKTSTIAAYQRNQSTVEGVGSRVFNIAIYDPATPYSRPSAGTAASLGKLTRDDVLSWYRSMYSPKNTTLILIGDLTAATARSVAESAIGNWNTPAPTLAPFVGKAQPVSGNRIILVDRPGSVQSQIYIGQSIAGWGNDDLLKITAAQRVLGGGVSNRVNNNLREKHGWSYGVFSTYNPLKGTGAFYISGTVRTNATDSSIAEAINEYKRIASEPVPESELTGHLTNVVSGFPSSVQSVQGLMGRLTTVVTYGLPLDYYSTYRERLAAVTPTDVSRVGSTYLTPNALTVVAVGDLKTIEAPIRALNLGTVEVWDAEGNKLR